MRKILLFILLLPFQLAAWDGWAQVVSVSRLVTSGADNTSVPGATVAIKGTTTIHHQRNLAGRLQKPE